MCDRKKLKKSIQEAVLLTGVGGDRRAPVAGAAAGAGEDHEAPGVGAVAGVGGNQEAWGSHSLAVWAWGSRPLAAWLGSPALWQLWRGGPALWLLWRTRRLWLWRGELKDQGGGQHGEFVK